MVPRIPQAPAALRPPPEVSPWREGLAAARDLARLLAAAPGLARHPRGPSRPVLLVPGFGTGEASLGLLRAWLRRLGHRVWGWGLGRNAGDVPTLLPRVVARLEEVASAAGAPVHLVGWSLGGYLAREAARERPDLAAQVITLGSPVVGGPKYTAAAPLFRRRGLDLDAVEAQVEGRYDTPLAVPVLALYSRTDGIVAWGACIDTRSPRVDHVEVRASHLGLGLSPDVYRLVAERLRAPPSAPPGP